MRLTRHAKNNARWLRVSLADVEEVIAHPISVDRDENGKRRYKGLIRGVCVRVVVALDEPDLIVTIHDRRY
jgi:hypothetical protein